SPSELGDVAQSACTSEAPKRQPDITDGRWFAGAAAAWRAQRALPAQQPARIPRRKAGHQRGQARGLLLPDRKRRGGRDRSGKDDRQARRRRLLRRDRAPPATATDDVDRRLHRRPTPRPDPERVRSRDAILPGLRPRRPLCCESASLAGAGIALSVVTNRRSKVTTTTQIQGGRLC